MGKQLIEGSVAEVAERLAHTPELAGKTVRLVLVVEGELATIYAAPDGAKAVDPRQSSVEEYKRILEVGDADLVAADHVDDSREAIYTRMGGA